MSISEGYFKDARNVYYKFGSNETLPEIVKQNLGFPSILKFVTKYLKFEDVCRGLDLLYKELYGDPWNSILLASEVYQSRCHSLWFLTITFKMNPLTKWVSDEVCLKNLYYQGEYLYPSESEEESGKALISKAGKPSENRKHWILIPSYDREFTYKIYNHAYKGYLNASPTKKRNHRHTLVNNDYTQLWNLKYSTEDEMEIDNMDFNETLYAHRRNSNVGETIEVFTGKNSMNLGNKAVWGVSFWCNE